MRGTIDGDDRLVLGQQTVQVLDKADVVVAGAGIAGWAAAVAAGRMGAQVILVEQDAFPGGAVTAGMMAQWGAGSARLSGMAEELLDRLIKAGGAIRGSVIPMDPELFKDVSIRMLDEANVKCLFFAPVLGAVLRGEDVAGVIIARKPGLAAILGKVVIDATGDADVAVASGVPFVKGREADGRMRPVTLMFRIGNVDVSSVVDFVRKNPDQFLSDPDRHVLDLAAGVIRVVGFFNLVKEAKARGELDPDCHYVRIEGVFIERRTVLINTTRVYGVDGTDPRDLTRAMLAGRQQMHQVITFLHKYVPGFERAFLIDSGSRLGVRETRRIVGQYVLTEEDIAQDISFPDTIARASMRHVAGLDVHSPDAGEGSESDPVYRTLTMPILGFNIPYRSLLPKGKGGLLVAGRCMSVTQEADRFTRNQPPCLLSGQAAGTAAALGVRNGIDPSRVEIHEIQSSLRRQGVDLGNH
jgi:hypothetical protein